MTTPPPPEAGPRVPPEKQDEFYRDEGDRQALARLRAEQEPRNTVGTMHPADKAFYDLTVKQRDAAWQENAALLARAEQAEAERDKYLRLIQVANGELGDVEDVLIEAGIEDWEDTPRCAGDEHLSVLNGVKALRARVAQLEARLDEFRQKGAKVALLLDRVAPGNIAADDLAILKAVAEGAL